jgi:transposase InsO family protein
MQIDRGKEFMNAALKSWCWEQGINIQMTALYSLSQNGVAERVNRTLVELVQAMICGQDLPEFLWEPAIVHAAYLRNRAYTRTLQDKTPYEAWFKRKPDMTHLREFGAAVWVLLQGQHVEQKLLPQSKRRAYVGFEDRPQAVKYYNTETHKILTSCNF